MDLSPLFLSLETAFIATIITFFAGIYAALIVIKTKKTKYLLDIIFTLPLVLPPTVVGFFLLFIFGRASIIGNLLDKIGFYVVFNIKGAILASFIASFPIMYRISKGAFEHIDKNIINAAETLGKSHNWIFWRIIIPNSKLSIFAGIILSFARALGEFGATIMVAGNIPKKTQTMSLAVYTAVQSGDKTLAFKWVIIMIIISFITITMMNIITYKTTFFKKKNTKVIKQKYR